MNIRKKWGLITSALAACTCLSAVQSASAQFPENFESGSLPVGWTTAFTGGGAAWTVVSTAAHGGSFSVFTTSPGSTSTSSLTLPSVTASGPVTIDFWSNYLTEGGFDWWNLQVSINGAAFTSAAANNVGQGAWQLNGYNYYLSTPTRCFSGLLQNAWIHRIAVVNANPGDTVQFRFGTGTDSSGTPAGSGIWLDDINVTTASTAACCLPAGTCIIDTPANCAAASGTFNSAAACGSALCIQAAKAETEPNESKTTATVVTLASQGDYLSGATTGTVTTAGATSVDYYRVKTPAASPGIYRHRLELRSTGAQATTDLYVGKIQGLGQTGATAAVWNEASPSVGTATTTDTLIQTSATSNMIPPRTSQWYGFGKQEELYYRVEGTTATTGNYRAVWTSEQVTPTDIGTFASGLITISAVGQGHTTDTDMWVYDSNFNAITGWGNDGASTNGGAAATSTQSFLKRNFAPGTYYIGMTITNLASNKASPCDDNNRTGNLLDFPDSAVGAATLTGTTTIVTNVSFAVTDVGGVPVSVPGNRTGSFDVLWYKMTVVNVTGACCAPDGTCAVVGASSCVAPSLFQGTSVTACGPSNTCPNPTGACCDMVSGACTYINGSSCPVGQTFSGPNSVCSPNTCVISPAECMNFDSNAVGSLPGGYSSLVVGAGADWAVTAAQSHSAPNAVFTNDVATVSEQSLTLPPYTALGNVILNFWSYYACEGTTSFFDGWIVEADINGAGFVNIGSSAWMLNGYNATISTCCTNPIAGQAAFGGTALTWTQRRAMIAANTGDTVTIRFRMASDTSTSSTGVYLDDICLYNLLLPSGACCNGTTCSIQTSTACASASGSYLGSNSTCNPAGSNSPTCTPGACCTVTSCTNVLPSQCAASAQFNAGQACASVTCPTTGACCVGTSCSLTWDQAHGQCLSGTWNSGQSCTPNNFCFPHDNCSGAMVISGGGFSDSYPAVDAGADLDVTCNSSSATGTNNGAWYTRTPSSTVVATFAETNSSFDTVRAVFTGTCGSLTQIACADAESLTLQLAGGTQYYFLVGMYSATPSTSTDLVSVTYDEAPLAPNDVCASANVISGSGYTDSYAAFTAGSDQDVTCNSTSATGTNNGAWYTYTPAANVLGRFAETGTLDTVVAAFTGTCGSLTQIACSDTPETLDLNLTGGTQYYFLVGIWSSTASTSTTQISITYTEPMATGVCCSNTTGACTVQFDNVACATTATVNNSVTTCAAGTPSGSCPAVKICCNAATGACTVLYGGDCGSGTVQGTGTTCSAGTPSTSCPVLNVCCNDTSGLCVIRYDGGCDVGFSLASGTTCSAPNPCPPSGACCSGTTCTQILDSNSSSCADYRGANSVCTPNPCLPNDVCSGALPITVGSTYDVTIAADATGDIDATCNSATATATGYGVWYTITTGANAGTVSLTDNDSNDIITQVFSGSCGSLVPVSCSDTETGATHLLPSPNTTYYVLLGMWSGTTVPTGSYSLTVNSFTFATGACCDGNVCSTGVAQSACFGDNKVFLGINSTCTAHPPVYEAPNASVPDGNSSTSTVGVLERTLTVSGASSTVTSIAITIDYSHTWAGDNQIYIIAPDNTTAPLIIRAGATSASCDAFGNPGGFGTLNDLNGVYVISDAGTITWAAAAVAGPAPLASGTYKASGCTDSPVVLNTVFAAVNPNGVWKLRIEDHGAGDLGTLRAWGLTINGAADIGACDTSGACCSGTTCTQTLAANCASGFQGSGSTCSPTNPCVPSTQYCCRGSTCLSVSAGTCTGTVAGSASLVVGSCGPANTYSHCCFADFNHSGASDIDDIFIFLAAWFDSSPYANVGGNGTALPDIDDIFIWLNYWFAGCNP